MAGTTRTVKVRFDGDTKGLKDATKEGAKDVADFGNDLKTAVAGLAIGGAVTKSFTDGLNFDAGTDKLAAQLNLTKEQSEQAGRVAGELYANAYGDSMDQVNAALHGLIQDVDGMSETTDAELQQMGARALDLATILEEDVGGVTRAVGQLIKTGLARDATEAFDIITAATQNGVNKSQDLLDTINEYPTVFRDAGLSGADSMGLMSQGLAAGARDADTVADALKEFAIRAQDGSDTSAAGFKAIGLNAREMTSAVAAGGPRARDALDKVLDGLNNMRDPAKRNAAAVALFGTKAEDLGDALFALDLDSAATGLGKLQGRADDVGKSLGGNAKTSVAGSLRDLQKTGADLASRFLPILAELTSHRTTITALAAAVLALTAAWVIHTAALKVYAGWQAAVTVATKAWTAAQWLLNTAFLANPLVAIIAVIVAVIAVIVLIATKTTWFQQLWSFAWGQIQGAAQAVWNWIQTAWAAVGAFLSSPFTSAKRVIDGVWGGIKSGVTAVQQWVKTQFTNMVSTVAGLPGRIGKAASGMWDGIKTAFKGAVNWIIRGWNNIGFTIGGQDWDPAGKFGPTIHIPQISLSTPNIDELAAGGIVPATRGGRIVRVAEGGEAEAVTPLSKLADMMGDTHVYVTIDGQQLEGRIDRVVRESNRQTRRAVMAGSTLP